MGFGGECGGSRAARADGAVVWVWNRRSEQLERMVHDWVAHHGLGNGGCCEVGEPARVLFDAGARDDQHKYSDRSLRGTSRGSSRAASGGPPPLEIPGRGGWDRPGFFLGGSGYSLVPLFFFRNKNSPILTEIAEFAPPPSPRSPEARARGRLIFFAPFPATFVRRAGESAALPPLRMASRFN